MTLIETSMADEWLAQLQANGFRVTHPRKVIVEELVNSQRALEPVDLFAICRKRDPKLGLVTVYRTLDQLEQLGLIQRVHQADGCHTVMRKQNGHEHLLVCTVCGKTVPFNGDNFENLSRQVANDTGFAVSDHMLQFFGICPECQKVEKKAS
jgi:Fe2+ or Zn2+ uptake regulation protein